MFAQALPLEGRASALGQAAGYLLGFNLLIGTGCYGHSSIRADSGAYGGIAGCFLSAIRRRLIDKMGSVTIPARLVPLGRAFAIVGLGLLLAPLGRLQAQAAPAASSSSTSPVSQPAAHSATPAQPN